MSQLAMGRVDILFWAGRANMRYRSVSTPGSSIMIQAILPGMLNRESMEVLPIGYQVTSH